MPRGARAPRQLCQQSAGTELLLLEGNTGNPLSSSASPSGTGFLLVEEEGEGHSSPNPFPSHTRGWQLQALVRMAGLSILSGLQINEIVGGPLRIWCWMVIMDAPSVEVFQDSFFDLWAISRPNGLCRPRQRKRGGGNATVDVFPFSRRAAAAVR